jgi:hypothetical protein
LRRFIPARLRGRFLFRLSVGRIANAHHEGEDAMSEKILVSVAWFMPTARCTWARCRSLFAFDILRAIIV